MIGKQHLWQDARVWTRNGTAAAFVVAAASLLAACGEVEDDREKRGLITYFSRGRGDNFSGATLEAADESVFKAYQYVRLEGQVATKPGEGLVPLELYWHEKRGDYFLTATEEGKSQAQRSGYELIRVEGWAHEKNARGRLPLKLFWSEGRGDNYTTANPQGEKDALNAGYEFVRIEAYIDPP